MRAIKSFLLVVLAAIAIGVVVYLTLLGLRLKNTADLAQESTAFQMLNPDAGASVLIVGDSAGVGTGAVLASASVAGRIAQHYPCASLVNRARDGAATKDVIAQLEGTGDTPFDLLLMQIGANDVLLFTKLDELRRALGDALSHAASKADQVVLMISANVGLAPIFMPPLDAVYERRARQVQKVFIEAADAAGVTYIDLFEQSTTGPLAKDPRRYYASDYLHLNGEGYALWYQTLSNQLKIGSILEC